MPPRGRRQQVPKLWKSDVLDLWLIRSGPKYVITGSVHVHVSKTSSSTDIVNKIAGLALSEAQAVVAVIQRDAGALRVACAKGLDSRKLARAHTYVS